MLHRKERKKIFFSCHNDRQVFRLYNAIIRVIVPFAIIEYFPDNIMTTINISIHIMITGNYIQSIH